LIGTTLGSYRIIDRLGAGGMGVVYRAEDTRLHRQVAIKFLPPGLSHDPDARARFMTEARAASALDHPGIGAIFQVDEAPDGQMYLVMACYEGETLDRAIKRGTLTPGEASRVALQIAEALGHAHAKGIIHRDIKPSNVMRTTDGMVKVLDFGLARIAGAEGLTRTGVSVGTPSYMSPEQLQGLDVDARTDLWSLGALLHALLAGRSPFDRDSDHSVYYAILNEPPPELPEDRVPAPLRAVIARALERDLAARYPDAAAMAADLRAAHAGDAAEGMALSSAETRPAFAMPSTARPVAPPRPRTSLRPWVWAAGSAALAAAAWFTWTVLPLSRPAALRVVALAPEWTAAADSLAAAAAAAGAHVAVLRGLAGLEGVVALDPADQRGLEGSSTEIAAALAADAVVAATLREAGEEWRIALRRLAPDGSVGWTSEFAVPRDNALLLADAVIAHLARGFPERSARKGSAGGGVTPADYAEFLTLRAEFAKRGGGALGPAELEERIEALRRRAPGFLEIHLLEADHRLYLYLSAENPVHLEESRASAERARELAPEDPRAAARLFEAELRGDDPARAAALLDELRRLDPGNPAVQLQAAALAERRGEIAAALAALRAAVKQAPTRDHQYALADLEYRQGHYDDARRHLEALTRDHPDHLRSLAKLAELELLYGDLPRAESLYVALVERAPGVASRLTNLGLARMLLGRYDEAAADLKAASQIGGEGATELLNLADCEKLRGNGAESERLYARVLEQLERNPSATRWEDRLLRAQSLAHLGRFGDAVAEAQEALRESPENAEVLYATSLVYAIAGERTSALVNARRAIEAGVSARWFSLPWFEALRSDPEFGAALARGPRRPA
jgi:serine/threonine-protein kinase